MKQYSQNDAQWKALKHGTSNSTIGSTGCTITALAMALASIGYDENPKTANQKLTENGGYSSGNLLLWTAIEKIWPRAKFLWRGKTYTTDDNAKVADAIKKYGSCLVEVDATPIGGTKHWVLYIGNQRLIDPFDGLEKPTSTYSAIGYATIELIPGIEESKITILTSLYEKLVTKSSAFDNFVNNGFENVEQVIAKIKALSDTIDGLNQLITSKNTALSNKDEEISTLNGQLLASNDKLNTASEQAKKVPNLVTQVEHLTEEKNQFLKDAITYNKKIAQLQIANDELRSKSVSLLVRVTLERITNYLKAKLHIN
jgi:uncharacterized protein YoxC